jgi:hypothetical protein
MYANRYTEPCIAMPRVPAHLPTVLTVLKKTRPDLFHIHLQVTPETFDCLVAAIENNPVFINDSNNRQMSVAEQLAIMLYRFGRSGNSASIWSVANWAGVGWGTVLLVTRQVMMAVLRPQFMQAAVRMPTADEKEEAKSWVHRRSCAIWQDGWCMVDRTLIPLFTRPYWYGESYFNQKCNYSLNIQVSFLLLLNRELIWHVS